MGFAPASNRGPYGRRTGHHLRGLIRAPTMSRILVDTNLLLRIADPGSAQHQSATQASQNALPAPLVAKRPGTVYSTAGDTA